MWYCNALEGTGGRGARRPLKRLLPGMRLAGRRPCSVSVSPLAPSSVTRQRAPARPSQGRGPVSAFRTTVDASTARPERGRVGALPFSYNYDYALRYDYDYTISGGRCAVSCLLLRHRRSTPREP